MALLIVLWIPIGFPLSCLRVATAVVPMPIIYYAWWALGVRIIINGRPPPPVNKSSGESGVLFLCSHRTLLEPIFLSTALDRPIPANTYSLSRFSEFISPIKTVHVSRERATDAALIKKLLQEGDLVLCPEGTTCREPFLLRFSSLFVELTDELVPVAMVNHMSMFHGTTVLGWKGMDPFYFLMNPIPAYEVTFLNKLPRELTCGAGKSSHEVANYIQRVIASTLSYECIVSQGRTSIVCWPETMARWWKSGGSSQVAKPLRTCAFGLLGYKFGVSQPVEKKLDIPSTE